ncbi:ribosome-associated ATPase/putative transporter RbbA [Aggregatibacter actinomycetemcomitans]|uniref:ribosome-associated ATPase/putative transporter RbbA n=1 Tax=Aggregatibacter actinomycetemcomitans TaxID=714 RepID=UPI0004375EA6|nr:ribosome-associated ATPase/putative transporter RbbA [Aggregatibacter actinomycetemcomitans]AHN72332.1 ABC transporter, ATP-binding protein, putative [Aggregatibacter actinomycetemcomitans HK1651]QPQ81159.1 ribosome-associated ATPase/putative transporter RbbA [Aggregatibacter actinomycetemcomitans]
MTAIRPAVAVEHLSHSYGKTTALYDVSLRIPRGATVGLIGPDGVGKSTLLSLIAGVKIIQTGSVQVFDLNVAEKKARDALSHKIAFMPQGLGKNLYLTLSIYENIDFHARLFGLNKPQRQARIQRLLNATGLAPFADRAAGKLSGGMKQKLSLCCALVHSPDLLILDEPTTGVDPLSRRQFWQLVEDLRREENGMTVIVATAYIDEAERFEHILAMDDGKLIANAPTKQVIADTQSHNLEEAYVKLLPAEKRGAENGLHIQPFKPNAEKPPVIVAKGLTKKFGDFVSVDNVSFTIPKGEIFGFLGSNGCGKSTTMKMLTGLLDPTEGSATLLGQPIDAGNIDTRKRVGYMSQAFSLYEELSVYQNLELHAKLYQTPRAQWAHYVQSVMQQFDLIQLADEYPSALPLGIRQRLQLAAACLHKPEVLILDEPTSGVDPAARDMFWEYLIKLSREDKITIFVTTHFMNEAARCDRISFMHRGRVLAVGTPESLRLEKKAPTLEEAFIAYLEEQADDITAPKMDKRDQSAVNISGVSADSPEKGILAWWSLVWTFAVREGKELLRDRIRLFFALLGPVIMLFAMASSISFDVHPSNFTVLDYDNSSESRRFIEYFDGSRYFVRQPDIHSPQEINQVLQSSKVKLVIEIPPDFGKKVLQRQMPEVGFFIDGAFPSTAENLRGSVVGAINQYVQETLTQQGVNVPNNTVLEPRFVYNPDFKSIFAMTPGVIMLTMMLIPSMMTALGVVREKEIGSIMNLYGSPAGAVQFLLGKQLPYILLAFISYLIMVWMSVMVFNVPVKGSMWAMTLGALFIITASTAFGLFVSSFVKSQIAAIFATAIIVIIPTMNFSGMLYPTSTLPPHVYMVAQLFPGYWFLIISLGGFTKGLGFMDFLSSYGALLAIYAVYFCGAVALLKKQEK